VALTLQERREGASRSGLSCLGIKDKVVRAMWSMTKQKHMVHVTQYLTSTHSTRYSTETGDSVLKKKRLGKSNIEVKDKGTTLMVGKLFCSP
jgi:hypothetical protein